MHSTALCIAASRDNPRYRAARLWAACYRACRDDARISGVRCVNCGQLRTAKHFRFTEQHLNHCIRIPWCRTCCNWRMMLRKKRNWEALKARFDYRCLACGKREPEITLTRDHVIPRSRGGIHRVDNIQPLCGRCNAAKAATTLDLRG